MTIDGSNVNATKNAEKIKAEKEALLKIEYEECLNASVNESDDTEKIKEMKKTMKRLKIQIKSLVQTIQRISLINSKYNT